MSRVKVGLRVRRSQTREQRRQTTCHGLILGLRSVSHLESQEEQDHHPLQQVEQGGGGGEGEEERRGREGEEGAKEQVEGGEQEEQGGGGAPGVVWRCRVKVGGCWYILHL